MTAGADTTGLITRRKLSPQVRAGLDLARAVAAVYVVLHHIIKEPAPVALLFQWGQEAVLVFFLLSGFVIFANEERRVHRVRGYYLRRVRRIYPPMIVAMLVSTVVWALGWIDAEFSWQSLVGTLFALQDVPFLKPGVIVAPYLDNFPLWSLSYEIFFYAVFPLVMILWRRSASVTRWVVPAVAVAAFVTYLLWPNHFSLVTAYFLLWWVGAMAAHLYTLDRMRLREAVPELVGLAAFGAAAVVSLAVFGWQGIVQFPFVDVRSAVAGTVFFLVLFTPLRGLLGRISFRVAGPAVAVAGISYGLYVVHYPVLVQTDAYLTWWLVPALVATVVLARVADKWVPSLLPRAPKD